MLTYKKLKDESENAEGITTKLKQFHKDLAIQDRIDQINVELRKPEIDSVLQAELEKELFTRRLYIDNEGLFR